MMRVEQYRSICRKFAGMSGYDGWMIAKVVLKTIRNAVEDKTQQSESQSAYVVKRRGRYAVLKTSVSVSEDMDTVMEMHLINPIVPAILEGTAVSNNLRSENVNKIDDHVVYRAEQIMQFVTDVEDNNFIHRGNHPVVPGLLMLETLIQDAVKQEQSSDISIVFEHPVYADEIIYIERESEEICGYVIKSEDKERVWKAKHI